MQRLSRSLRLAPSARAPRTSPFPRSQAPAVSPRPVAASYATKSSPKSAEKASAQSGGSRSKDAVESGAVQGRNEQDSPSNGSTEADPLSARDARGRTGGGAPLKASKNAPPKPKITNASVPGSGPVSLTPEQQKEVDEHNRVFEEKHDRASPASDDKVDKSFWAGGGQREASVKERDKKAAEGKGEK